jgi:hypothetical protein
LNAIRSFMASRKETPTLQQIALLTNMKVPTVNYYMQQLKDDGLVCRVKHSREIELTGAAPYMRISARTGRKLTSASQAEVNAKKADGAKRAREIKLIGAGRKAYEAECFERAVAFGKARDQAEGEDVLHDRYSLFRNGQVRACKVG